MSFRITTGGVYRNYKTNLHASMKKYSKTMTQVETGRSFTSYAEDPASASRAFQLRRSYWRTGDQIDNTNYLISKYSTAWDALDAIVDGTGETPGLDGIRDALTGLNGTAGGTRQTLGTTLWNISESIIKVMNTRYGDEFVFAGNDGMNAPFSWDSAGHMCYRGFQVNAPRPVTEEQFEQWKAEGALSSENIPDYNQFVEDTYGARIWVPSILERETGVTEPTAGQVTSFQDASFEDYQRWYVKTYSEDRATIDGTEEIQEAYARAGRRFDETAYEDIGIGMRADENGYTIPGTAFDSVVSGLDVLGYGMETVEVVYDVLNKYSFTTQVSNNMAEVMRQLAQIFLDCNPYSGEYRSVEDRALADVLTDRLQSAISHTQEQQVILDGKVDYLQKNLESLTNTKDRLDKQIVDLEDVDPADAITSMTWAQYCYSAALRVGQQILGESLLDYLR